MKKTLLGLLCLLQTLVFAQEPFLQLCQAFYEENLTIKEAKDSLKIAKFTKNENLARFIPELSIKGGLCYPQQDFQKEYPDYGLLSASLNQYLFWGATLSADGTFYYSKVIENDTKSYEPSAEASAIYTQSLAPYFMASIHNPDFYIDKLNYLSETEKMNYTRFTAINDFILLYLDYKKTMFQLELQEKSLAVNKESYEAEKQILENNQGSFLSLYDKQQKMISSEETLTSLKNQKEKLIHQFCQLFNYKFSEIQTELLLNESLNSNWKDNFIHYFGTWNIKEALKMLERIEDNNIERERSIYLLKRQTYAPQLKVIADCYFNVTEKHSLEVSVELDLSYLFSPENLNLKREYKINLKNKTEQAQLSKKQNQDTITEYEKQLYILKESYKKQKEEFDFMETLYKDYKSVYAQGNCSKLDFYSLEINYLQMKSQQEMIQDQINYYSLLLNVEISE